MSTYGVFESLEASADEGRLAAIKAENELDQVFVAVQQRHGAYLNNARSQDDFWERMGATRSSIRKVCESMGVHPRTGVMGRLERRCKNASRPHWIARQAAEGTSVDDAAPPPDLTQPVGTLTDSPIGAVASRRTAGADTTTGFETQPGMDSGTIPNMDQPTMPAQAVLGTRKVAGGFYGFLTDPRTAALVSASNEDFLPSDYPSQSRRRVRPEGDEGSSEEFYHRSLPVAPRKPVRHGPEMAGEGHYGGLRDVMQHGLRGLAEGMQPGGDESGLGAFFQGLDSGIENHLPPEIGRADYVHPNVKKHPGKSWQQHGLEGLQQGIGQGLRGASFRQLMAYYDSHDQGGGDTLGGGGLGAGGDLIPEADFAAYLNRVTGPETDKARSQPFDGQVNDGERWSPTASRRLGDGSGLDVPDLTQEQLQNSQSNNAMDMYSGDYFHGARSASPLAQEFQQRRDSRPSDGYNFTGSPETQYHHKQDVDWGGIGRLDEDALYDLMGQGHSYNDARDKLMRGAAVHYAQWAARVGAARGSILTAAAYANVSPLGYYRLMGGVRLADRIRKTAAGKDHLQTSQDAITKMLNELAEDFQKSILPLQDALQSVQYAQQTMQAQQSPMNVMPPGSINVLPDGMTDPNAAAGGAPPGGPGGPMQGQSMPAQPGPGGLSPMADPTATGGAPAAGGGDPLAALPPEVLQTLQALMPLQQTLTQVAGDPSMGGGAPAGTGADPSMMGSMGGGGGGPVQRPTARRYYAAEDDEDSDDGPPSGSDSDAPPFVKKDSDGGPPPPKKDSGSPAPFDGGPPQDDGGDDAETHAVVEAIIKLLDSGDIDTAQGLADQFDITDEDINSFAASDPYDTGDPFGAPAPAGPPPPADLPPGPPPGGPPLPPDHPEAIQARHIQRRAQRFIRWAQDHNMPVNRQSVATYVHGGWEEAARGRRPLGQPA